MSDMSTGAAGSSIPSGEASGGSESSSSSTTSQSTESSQSSSQGQETAKAAPSAAEVKEAIRKHKLKIEGEEVEVDDNELKRGYGLAKASQKRFEEAAQIKKEQAAFDELFKKNPAAAFKKYGIDPRQFATDYLYENVILEEQLTPEQKEYRDAKRKLAEYEEKEKESLRQREESELEAKTQEQIKNLNKEFTDAFKAVKIPPTLETVKKMSELMKKNLEHGYKLSAQDCAEIIRDSFKNDLNFQIKSYEGDDLLDVIGEENLDRINKAYYNRIKTKQNANKKDVVTNMITSEAEVKKKKDAEMTPQEFNRYLRGF